MMSLSACDKKVSSSHFLKGHIVKHLSSHFCFIHRFICLVGYWIRPLICCQLGHKIAQWTAGARPWDCIMYDWHPKAELHNCVKFSGLRFRSLGWSSLLTPEKKRKKKVIFQSLHSGEHTVIEMTFHIFTVTPHARVRCRGQCRQAQGTRYSMLLPTLRWPQSQPEGPSSQSSPLLPNHSLQIHMLCTKYVSKWPGQPLLALQILGSSLLWLGCSFTTLYLITGKLPREQMALLGYLLCILREFLPGKR